MNNKNILVTITLLIFGAFIGYFFFQNSYQGSFLYSYLIEPTSSKAIDQSLSLFESNENEDSFSLPTVVSTKRNIIKVLNSKHIQQRLRYLYIENLDPTLLAGKISNLKLASLTLIDCKNGNLPEDIYTIDTLTYLEIGNCKLNKLSHEVANLRSLQSLVLYKNNISTLPDSFSTLQNLETLDLRGNQLTSVPEVLYKLQNLKQVRLEGNLINNQKEIDNINKHLSLKNESAN